jgi:aspartate kinase
MGYPAISLTGTQIKMMTDSVHTKARIESIGAEKIKEHCDQGKIVIVAGFQGVDEKGNITTLGRGGSDTTAVAIAAAVGAQECEIYTDVDAIYTTDPRMFKDAAKLEEISYDEMLELASLGAGVLHNRAVEFGKKYDVTIHLRSSTSDEPGTIITHEVPKMEGVVVSGATVKKHMAKISLIEVDNTPGSAANVFAHLAHAKVVVDDIVQTELSPEKANLAFTVGTSDLPAAKNAVEQIKQQIGCRNIFIREDISEISVVGVGMRSHYGVAQKMFGTLAEHQINIDSITTSEIRMSCIIDKDQVDEALDAVCRAFELDKPVDERTIAE